MSFEAIIAAGAIEGVAPVSAEDLIAVCSAVDEVITRSGINDIRATESEDAIVAVVP